MCTVSGRGIQLLVEFKDTHGTVIEGHNIKKLWPVPHILRNLKRRRGFCPPHKNAAVWCVPFSGAVGLFNELQTQKKMSNVDAHTPVPVSRLNSQVLGF